MGAQQTTAAKKSESGKQAFSISNDHASSATQSQNHDRGSSSAYGDPQSASSMNKRQAAYQIQSSGGHKTNPSGNSSLHGFSNNQQYSAYHRQTSKNVTNASGTNQDQLLSSLQMSQNQSMGKGSKNHGYAQS